MLSTSLSVFLFILIISIAEARFDLKFNPMFEEKYTWDLDAAVDDFPSSIRWPHRVNMIRPYGYRLLDFSWKNCGKPTDLVQIQNITLGPDPIYFPGNMDISFKLNMLKAVHAPVLTVLTLDKKVGSQWINVPCMGQIGSCTYDDMCALLASAGGCPKAFVDNKIPCKCPYKAGTYTLPESKFELSAVPFPAGDYRLKAVFSMDKTPVGCYILVVTIGN